MENRKGNANLWEMYGDILEVLMDTFDLNETERQEIALNTLDQSEKQPEPARRYLFVNPDTLRKLGEDGQALILSYVLVGAISRGCGFSAPLEKSLAAINTNSVSGGLLGHIQRQMFASGLGHIDLGVGVQAMERGGYSVARALKEYHKNVAPLDLMMVDLIRNSVLKQTAKVGKLYYALVQKELDKYKAVPLEQVSPTYEKVFQVLEGHYGKKRLCFFDVPAASFQEAVVNVPASGLRNIGVISTERNKAMGFSDEEQIFSIVTTMVNLFAEAKKRNPNLEAMLGASMPGDENRKRKVVLILDESSVSLKSLFEKMVSDGNMSPKEALEWTTVALKEDVQFKELCELGKELKSYVDGQGQNTPNGTGPKQEGSTSPNPIDHQPDTKPGNGGNNNGNQGNGGR